MKATTTKTVRRLAVVDAAATVRARRQELANPAAYCTTRERAEARLSEAMAEFERVLAANPSHTAPVRLY